CGEANENSINIRCEQVMKTMADESGQLTDFLLHHTPRNTAVTSSVKQMLRTDERYVADRDWFAR
ncbi:MAG TPA: hypothetical protein VFL47_17195, partial [Flavisolibacter sp.]|nr:hypothetical protein [Flavisolibacter sp.]